MIHKLIRMIKRVTDLLLLRKSFREAVKRELKEHEDTEERAKKRMTEILPLFPHRWWAMK